MMSANGKGETVTRFDWSTLHTPSGDLLYNRPGRNDWKKYMLSSESVGKFWRDGYISNIPILSEGQCDLILEDYKYFMGDEAKQHPGHDLLYEYHSNQSDDPSNVLMHCLGQWRVTSLFHDLVFHPEIVAKCSQLVMEGELKSVRFFHDQLFAKPAFHGGNVAWHQDYSYWTRTEPCMHVTVHIALDEQTDDNGGLLYIPGSHRWSRDGKPLPVLDFNFKDMEGIKTILSEEEKAAFQPRSALLKKGEASFHSAMIVHGSYGNRSAFPRRAVVLNYFADGVMSNTNDNMLVIKGKEVGNQELYTKANIPKGEKMQGQFYPLVFDKNWISET